jgi:hypothetical protein
MLQAATAAGMSVVTSHLEARLHELEGERVGD